MDNLFSTLLIVIFLLVAEAFFSGSEYMLVSFSQVKLRRLAEGNHRWAMMIVKFFKDPDKLFGATSIGTNICVIASSAIVTAYISKLSFDLDPDFLSILIMGPLTLILGEIVPKIIFREKADKIAKHVAKPLDFSIKFFTPLLKVTSWIAKVFIFLFKKGRWQIATILTREELLALTKKEEILPNLGNERREMLDRIFEFGSSSVTTVMTPLGLLDTVSADFTIAQIKKRFVETGYSRLPVYSEKIFNIIGIVSAFDLIENAEEALSLEDIMRKPLYVPTSKRNTTLLKDMRNSKEHMAVVVDEYGATEGVVTIEDLIEEIVGEIEDEYDTDIKEYEKLSSNSWIIDAGMQIDRINDLLSLLIPDGDYETIGGLVIDAIEEIPDKGKMFALGNYIFTVLDSTETRVLSVQIEDVLKSGDNGESK